MPKDHPIRTTPLFRPSKMTSGRRVKVLFIAVLVFVITVLLWTNSVRHSREIDPRTFGDFYSNTVKGLEKKPGSAINDEDEEIARQMAQRLNEAAKQAKNNANIKSPKPDAPSDVIGVGSSAEGSDRSVAGRKKYSSGEAQEPLEEETKEDHEITEELTSILRKAPIIIFSKSYCPHSRDAKRTFEKYSIDPAPYIVELDQHPLGAGLQTRLAELTGRKTVPNVLINAVSIGGGDDMIELDRTNQLIEKIKEYGGKQIFDVSVKPTVETDHGLR